MIPTPRSIARLSALMLTLFASGCGGDDDSTGPQLNPDFMVGEWIAESMVVTSKANPEIAPDITDFGATFTLSVQPSGRYLAILAGYGQSSSELTVEVASHMGDGQVRTIAMGPTDGLQRGLDRSETVLVVCGHAAQVEHRRFVD